MSSTLSDLIRSVASSESDAIGKYVFLYGPNKKVFGINPSKVGEFIEGYCNLAGADQEAEDNGEDGLQLNLAESTEGRDTIPVRGVFNIKIHNTLDASHHSSIAPILDLVRPGSARPDSQAKNNTPPDEEEIPIPYTPKLLMHIIYYYQRTITKYLNITPPNLDFICATQESNPKIKDGYVHFQIIFHFPYCQCSAVWQKNTLRPEVIQLLRQNQVMSMFTSQPIGDWDAIIEDIGSAIPMYRSVCDPVKSHPQSGRIYGPIDVKDLESSSPCRTYSLSDVFNSQEHSYIKRRICPDIIAEKSEIALEHWMPLFYSIFYYTGVTSFKEELKGEVKMIPSSEQEDFDEEDPHTVEGQRIIANNLLPLLTNVYANSKHYWLDVGRVLYNLYDGNDEGKAEFVKFSARATVEGRDKEACETAYPNLKNSPYTVKTIAWYAKTASESAYNEWHEAWSKPALDKAMETCLPLDVAMAVYRLYWLDHICVNVRGDRWCYFKNNILHETAGPEMLRRDIERNMIRRCEKIQRDVSQRIYEIKGSDAEKKHAEAQLVAVANLIRKLKHPASQGSIIRMCRDQFSIDKFLVDSDFYKIRDSNPYKTGWRNCVVELGDNNAWSRPGKPEDYITMSMAIPYHWEYNWKTPLILRLMAWFTQLFPEGELLRHFLKHASSILYGRNAEKYFPVWCGDGDGGKSKLQMLFQETFGRYYFTIPISAITGSARNAGNGPNPELAQAQGAHVGFASEPSKGMKLRTDIIKGWTGGDPIYARFCNENGGSFIPMFKLFLVCNDVPTADDAGNAFKNRFLYFPFMSQYVDNPPPSDEEQKRLRRFKKDPYFEQQIPELAGAFGWVIVQYYKLYKDEGLVPPAVILRYTENYWRENDLYNKFKADKIVQALNSEGKVDAKVVCTCQEIYPIFKQYCKDEGMKDGEIPTLTMMKHELIDKYRLGPMTAPNGWRGVKVVVSATIL